MFVCVLDAFEDTSSKSRGILGFSIECCSNAYGALRYSLLTNDIKVLIRLGEWLSVGSCVESYYRMWKTQTCWQRLLDLIVCS